MDFTEEQFDLEAYESAVNQINYYINIPSYIKGTGPKEDSQNKADLLYIPARVISGWTTVINGRLNMPKLEPSF